MIYSNYDSILHKYNPAISVFHLLDTYIDFIIWIHKHFLVLQPSGIGFNITVTSYNKNSKTNVKFDRGFQFSEGFNLMKIQTLYTFFKSCIKNNHFIVSVEYKFVFVKF